MLVKAGSLAGLWQPLLPPATSACTGRSSLAVCQESRIGTASVPPYLRIRAPGGFRGSSGRFVLFSWKMARPCARKSLSQPEGALGFASGRQNCCFPNPFGQGSPGEGALPKLSQSLSDMLRAQLRWRHVRSPASRICLEWMPWSSARLFHFSSTSRHDVEPEEVALLKVPEGVHQRR